MEEIKLIDEYGTRIYATAIDTLDTVEIGVIGDYSAVSITKEQSIELAN